MCINSYPLSNSLHTTILIWTLFQRYGIEKLRHMESKSSVMVVSKDCCAMGRIRSEDYIQGSRLRPFIMWMGGHFFLGRIGASKKKFEWKKGWIGITLSGPRASMVTGLHTRRATEGCVVVVDRRNNRRKVLWSCSVFNSTSGVYVAVMRAQKSELDYVTQLAFFCH